MIAFGTVYHSVRFNLRKGILTSCIEKNFLYFTEDGVGLLTGINFAVESPISVISHQGLGQGMILLKSLLKNLWIVVVSSD